VRNSKDAAGELFRSIQRQKDQYQGIWIVSPQGKVLAGHHDFESRETWAQEVLDTADSALKSFGPVTERKAKATDPLPFRGQGVQRDGSVGLEIYVRQMMGGGRQNAPAGVPASRLWVWDGTLRPDGPIVIDTLTLPAKDWAAFAPPKTEPGTTWSLPEAVARQFSRVLVPSSDQSAMPRPEDSKAAQLTGTVESVEQGVARIRLAGTWEAVHLQEGDRNRPLRGLATAEGIAIYDVKQRELQSLLLVFSGAYGRPNEESLNSAGAVVKWRR
jgi:hypothetical protein